MKAIFWAAIMILLMLMMWSIVTVELFHPLNLKLAEGGTYDGCDRCPRAFESVAQSTLSLIQTIIAGDSWGMTALPIIENHPWTVMVFGAILLTVQLGLMNLVLAVIVDSAAEARAQDKALQLKL